jgi:hypothetical protein
MNKTITYELTSSQNLPGYFTVAEVKDFVDDIATQGVDTENTLIEVDGASMTVTVVASA